MGVNTSFRGRLRAALQALRAPAAAPVEEWRALTAEAPDLITHHVPDGRIIRASGAALLGRAPLLLEGLTPRDLVHPDDVASVQAAFREASYFGRDGAVTARLLHADGRHVWVELRCRRMTVGRGEEWSGDIVAVTREIAAFKAESAALAAARDAALAATQEKTRFLAAMSHELRTPLNAIIGFSEVMKEEMFGPLSPRYRDYAALIAQSGQHLLELINDVLDMAKIEAGKADIHQALFDLEAVAAGAARFVEAAAAKGGVELKAAVAPAARRAFADRRAVKQILLNLLSNAVKFTPPGGQVMLAVTVEGRAVVLTVADTGAGIAAEELARLGRPFAQGDNARGREGTGLGLALVKALAGLHGGDVMIRSVLGEGTVVTVRLPHAAVPLPAANVVPLRGAAA
ncbi:MAG: PAS domain-containing sensor histidine kinase [Alphaproteobacteria bacterium]|nr:PAS domain-containing sensor histidine kinase [Alphaproteobacteria bacterium]